MTYCKCCNTNLKELKSETNSTYFYCENCNTNKQTPFKHLYLDALLSTICKVLKSSKYTSLKIEVTKASDLLILHINDCKIKEFNFKHDFIKADIYFLENTIYDLIEDFSYLDKNQVDVLVCA